MSGISTRDVICYALDQLRGNPSPPTASEPDSKQIGQLGVGPTECRMLERLIDELRVAKSKKRLTKGTVTVSTTISKAVEHVDVDV